jgi:hypothetical protein
MSVPGRTCASCAAYCALAKECRAKSPQPVMVPSTTGDMVVLGVWPATRPENWCLEWSAAAAGN